MKILRVHIDGYGRLRGKELTFSPGLQIIIGPNEKGKSTLRCFISDMLYGQKSSLTRALYDESNALRMPWDNPKPYGGTLHYALDSGREISVSRSFHPEDEWCRILDSASGTDISEEFERSPNLEIRFAHEHLGLGKEVFAGSATIDHVNLDLLGDRDALEHIRDKLHSVADSGGAFVTAEEALHRLDACLESLGRPGTANKPLPLGRTRLRELGREMEEARALRREIADIAEKRHALRLEIEHLMQRREEVEEDVRVNEACERRDRLAESEQLLSKIDSVTQRCFGMGGVRDFPLERAADVQRAETRLQTARLQIERTTSEQRELRRQLEHEQSRAEPGWNGGVNMVSEELEKRWEAAFSTCERLAARRDELLRLQEEVVARLESAQKTLSSIPDFGRLGGDPIEWLTQLANSFQLAVRSRDEECATRDRLRQEMKQREDDLSTLRGLFQDKQDFVEKAREYELQRRMHDERLTKFGEDARWLDSVQEEIAEGNPQYLWLGLVCLSGLGGLGGVFYFTRNFAVLYPAGVLGLSVMWFLGGYFLGRQRLGGIHRKSNEIEAALTGMDVQRSEVTEYIENLLAQSGCDTLRELEAMYDEYRESLAELTVHQDMCRAQEEKAAGSEARVAPLLERVRDTFAKIGENVQSESDVPRVAGNTVARYHSYREAKRAWSESRATTERRRLELLRCEGELEQAIDAEEALETQLREALRSCGFEEETYEAVEDALRAYHERTAQYMELRGRTGLMEERAAELQHRLTEEQAIIDQANAALDGILGQAGVTSTAQWNATADKAREYRELRERRTAMEEQLNALLRGQEITVLRKQVLADGRVPTQPGVPMEECAAEMETISATITRKTQEAHALHVAMAERSGTARPIAEIEEERAYLTRQVDALELDFEAACHAMALIEDIARGRHACMAPVLAEKASRIFERITNGAYHELRVASDLSVSVRIPQTRNLETQPEKMLSKGTIDQIYFALRMAMVHAMNNAGETIPMLLDDPLANYDDTRLRQTMEVLAEAGKENQLLLFTCREDVVSAGIAAGAPVLRLD